MQAEGNGTPERCVHNLISIVQGENPYERCKGIDEQLTDSPAGIAAGMVAAEVGQVIENYEPRVEMEDAMAVIDDVLSGQFFIHTDINTEG